jgi:hypothetical protein
MSRERAQATAARKAEERQRAEAARAAEAERWVVIYDEAAQSIDDAREGLRRAQTRLGESRCATGPDADLLSACAVQDVTGAQAVLAHAREEQRAADWQLDRLGVRRWDTPVYLPEPADEEDDTPRCTLPACRSFKALDDDGRCRHHPL